MSDYGHSLQMDLVKMNGEAEAMQNMILSLPPMNVHNEIMDSEGAFDAWSREYRSAWREEKHERMDREEKQRNEFQSEMDAWDNAHPVWTNSRHGGVASAAETNTIIPVNGAPGAKVNVVDGDNAHYNPFTKTINVPASVYNRGGEYLQDYIRHEYGHYLQVEKYGIIFFLTKITPESVLSNASSRIFKTSHYNSKPEIDANKLSDYFYQNVLGIYGPTFNNPWLFPTK